MDKAGLVLKAVLEEITPSGKVARETEAALRDIRRATEGVVKSMGIGYTLAGSYLRNTWLADKKEFDIFLMFSETVPREALERDGLSAGKAIVKALGGDYQIAYAEHPYVKASVGGYTVDFVPCYDIKDPGKIKSAVDRTPHHNIYILRNLTGGLNSQVRLLKQFCKGVGVYGSDLRVEGFSGYLTELLVIKYGSFRNLLSEASSWQAGKVFIDLAAHHGERPDTKALYPGQPLVVIDPVDRKRNVAAALSPACFEKFRASCRAFLSAPSRGFFFPAKKAMTPSLLSAAFRKRGTLPLAVSFKRPEGIVDDVLFPQMRKSARRLCGMLSNAGFRALGSGVCCGERECAVFMELEVWSLPSVRRVTGPPVFSGPHVAEFTKKYASSGRLFVDGDCWVAETGRQETSAEKMIAKAVRGSAADLMKDGIASTVAEGLGKGFVLLSAGRLWKKAASSKELSAFLTEYLKSRTL